MSQLTNTVNVFSDTTSPGNQVNAAALNGLVGNAVLTNGSVISQNARTTPVSTDALLLGDTTAASTTLPYYVSLSNLLLQSQRDGTQRFGGTAGGTVNAVTVTTSPASSGAYANGEVIRFVTAGVNTGAVTINVDGRGVANLYSSQVVALIAGDLPAGAAVVAVYDGTRFQVASVATVNTHQLGQSARGDTHQYAVATGTNSLVVNPTDSNGSATFTAYATGMVVRFKNTTANTGACTLTVNGITGGSPNLLVNGATIPAGRLAAGALVTAVYDGTAFQVTGLTIGWDYVSGQKNAPAASGVQTFTHGLGVVPTKYKVVLVCVTATNGYSTGDMLDIGSLYSNSSHNTFQVVADATYISVIRTDQTAINIYPKGGGAWVDCSANIGAGTNNFVLQAFASL